MIQGEIGLKNQVQLGEPNRLMPLVTTYSRSYLPLHHQLKTNFKKHTSGLTQFQNCRVISAHRRNKNLRDILVRAKLPEQMRRIRSAKPDHWAFKLRLFCVQLSWKNRGTHSAENDPKYEEYHLLHLVRKMPSTLCGRNRSNFVREVKITYL